MKLQHSSLKSVQYEHRINIKTTNSFIYELIMIFYRNLTSLQGMIIVGAEMNIILIKYSSVIFRGRMEPHQIDERAACGSGAAGCRPLV